MLSWKSGLKIAQVKGGKRDKEFLYLQNEDNNNETLDNTDNPLDCIDPAFLKKYKLNANDIAILRKAIRKNTEPESETLLRIFHEVRNKIILCLKKEISIKDGVLQPLPNRDIVEKIYISAPSGAGKSTWIGNWGMQYKKMFRDNEIYIFSRVDEDKALDKLDAIRVMIDEDLIDEPVMCEEVQDSLVIADDTDTIKDRRIRNSILDMKIDMLQCGRHFNIRCLFCSHQLMNYKESRDILNESTCVVIFPKSGSTYHIKRFLKIYCGFEKVEIQKLLKLKSRWVAIYKTMPMYILHEHGCYLVN